jgi:CCR4-NOT transcription complex subunit 6
VGNATFFRTSLFDLVEMRKLEFMHLIDQLPCGAKVNKYFRTQFRISDKQAMVLMLRVKHPVTEVSSPSAPPVFMCLANTHIYWDPTYPSVKLMQVYLLTQAIEQAVAEWQRKEKLDAPGTLGPLLRAQCRTIDRRTVVGDACYTVPVVLCGDFNSLPTSSVYSLLAQVHPLSPSA